MPAKSKAQRRLFAIAEHHPEELYARNQSLAKLPDKTLHEFAATKEKNLPKRKPVHPALDAIRNHGRD